MPTLTPCEACGLAACPYENHDEPCYGQIQPVEAKQYEAHGYVGEWYGHACEGHKLGGMYVPEGETN